jgi:hypothetical protein
MKLYHKVQLAQTKGQGCTLETGVKKQTRGTWVQTERNAHELWDLLISQNANAARIMHRLVALMDSRGAVVVSQKTLGTMMGLHRNTIGRSIKVLEAQNWIETIQLGGVTGGVRCYVVNHRVAWADGRDKKRFASFDARIIASEEEQIKPLETDELHKLPMADEFQLPYGSGIEPPSQPAIEGLEPDLPAIGDNHLQQNLLD